jgi:anti-sigma-K factor RskA
MNSGQAHQELVEQAALYALGALDDEEARSFEDHLREGCDICRAEVDAFGEVVGVLSFGVTEQSPSPDVRERLQLIFDQKQRAGKDERASYLLASQFLSILADEVEWQELQKVVLIQAPEEYEVLQDNQVG